MRACHVPRPASVNVNTTNAAAIAVPIVPVLNTAIPAGDTGGCGGMGGEYGGGGELGGAGAGGLCRHTEPALFLEYFDFSPSFVQLNQSVRLDKY